MAALLIAGSGLAGTADAASTARPRIPKPEAVGAPVGEQGGVLSPFVSCTGFSIEPRVRWTLTRVATGESHTYRWRGALPGMYFPRVDAGTYRSRTTAWCSGEKLTRRHTVRVVQKTEATTLSREEFDRIRRGMTRARVRAVTGLAPRDCYRFGQRRACRYDNMDFWEWSVVTFRDGHVVGKDWQVDHD